MNQMEFYLCISNSQNRVRPSIIWAGLVRNTRGPGPRPGWLPVEDSMGQGLGHGLWDDEKRADIRIEGGSTLKTFNLPADAERVQYVLYGAYDRPIKAKVELWIGPLRSVHELVYDCDSGMTYPIKCTLKFKKGVNPTLKVSTNDSHEFPLICGVFVPGPEENQWLANITDEMFYSAPLKQRFQGGAVLPGGKSGPGSIRNFEIDPSWQRTQIMGASAD